MLNYNIDRMLASKEGKYLEFKENFGKEAIETITAFSNSYGGMLFIGVSNDNQILGIYADEEKLKDWANQLKQSTQPQLFVNMDIIEKENKTIVAILVNEYPIKPVSFKGKYYKRVGASNHLIELNEIVALQLQSINSSFDSFLTDTTYDELDLSVVNSFFEILSQKGRFNLSGDNLTKLTKLRLIKDNRLTFAALLLFGEHNTGIHLGRFKSEDVIIDDLLIKSPLVNAVDEAMHFILKNIQLRFEIGNQLRRTEKWQYPLTVIRELLLNAIIHKDYHNPTDVIIKIYDDRITFINPGEFTGGVTPEKLMKQDYTAYHRNKLLAEAFYLRADVEKFGTGYYRIFKELENWENLELKVDIQKYTSVVSLIDTDQDTDHETDHETDQDTDHETDHETDHDRINDDDWDIKKYGSLVIFLIKSIDQEYSKKELHNKLSVKSNTHMKESYLKPAQKFGLIEMTIPDKPNSKLQKYRLTEKGKKLRNKLLKEKNK